MVVGLSEKSDRKLGKGILRVKGKTFRVTVFGDTKAPERADVFAPDIKGKLPKTAKLSFKGKNLKAKLSFRTGRGGSRIPVFTAKLPKSLRKQDNGLLSMGERELGSVMGGLNFNGKI